MALDGVFLSLIGDEVNRRLEGARVDKIQQPDRDEIDIVFRLRSGSEKLLVSASPGNARVHFTQVSKENPLSAPMFCMLLRKHLSGGKFAGARQAGLERILFLDFDCYNELGDAVRRTLAAEIMGRHSNIILIDENERILDSIKHIDEDVSAVRQVLPGLHYELPPQQNKTSLLEAPTEQIVNAACAGRDDELPHALLSVMQGVSPVVCRELSQLACRAADARTGSLTPPQKERLIFFIARMAEQIRGGGAVPVMVTDAQTHRPLDFSFMEITQYGTAAATRRYEGFSELLEAFFYERDRIERFSRRSQDILKLLGNCSERVARRLENQRAELAKCEDRQALRVRGDLISSNLFRLQRGEALCELENYYEPGSPLLQIRLDPLLTPAQNAQSYYREYQKASAAQKHLTERIAADVEELAYLDSVFDELSRAESDTELSEIREELAGEGYLRQRGKSRAAKPRESKPLHYRSDDGIDVFVGRNNRQNDRLTLKASARSDLWLHTRNIPGAHVVIAAGGEAVPESTLKQAAVLAACHSRAKESRQVPVDYTLVRYVKKPAGAKPGKVIYEHFKTVFVNPDPQLAQRLAVKN
ncbi:MAG: NFACT RNA binding domain-containing protein [Clostridia bacterium]|nr:NFACT RNA binding domain-containing protein [Clostridia bacterium]